jgi:hypothetical protein
MAALPAPPQAAEIHPHLHGVTVEAIAAILARQGPRGD